MQFESKTVTKDVLTTSLTLTSKRLSCLKGFFTQETKSKRGSWITRKQSRRWSETWGRQLEDYFWNRGENTFCCFINRENDFNPILMILINCVISASEGGETENQWTQWGKQEDEEAYTPLLKSLFSWLSLASHVILLFQAICLVHWLRTPFPLRKKEKSSRIIFLFSKMMR